MVVVEVEEEGDDDEEKEKEEEEEEVVVCDPVKKLEEGSVENKDIKSNGLDVQKEEFDDRREK